VASGNLSTPQTGAKRAARSIFRVTEEVGAIEPFSGFDRANFA